MILVRMIHFCLFLTHFLSVLADKLGNLALFEKKVLLKKKFFFSQKTLKNVKAAYQLVFKFSVFFSILAFFGHFLTIK